MSSEDPYWTADFSKFRQKVESVFGSLEKLAEDAPDIYAHQVLSHGFMEYSGINELITKIKKQIIKERIETGDKEYKGYEIFLNAEDLPVELHRKIFAGNKERLRELEKQEYLKWAKGNNLPENLLEDGWQEYLND